MVPRYGYRYLGVVQVQVQVHDIFQKYLGTGTGTHEKYLGTFIWGQFHEIPCPLSLIVIAYCFTLLYPLPNEVGVGVYWIHLVRPSVRPSVCRRHGFRSIHQVCFGISISNFICMLMVAIGRSLLIFSNVTFKMAAWRQYRNFWFPDSNFTLALNINFKLQRHNTYVYG